MQSVVINQVFADISVPNEFVGRSRIQDDCLAINAGKNIAFENNYCSGGHGISIVGGLSE